MLQRKLAWLQIIENIQFNLTKMILVIHRANAGIDFNQLKSTGNKVQLCLTHKSFFFTAWIILSVHLMLLKTDTSAINLWYYDLILCSLLSSSPLVLLSNTELIESGRGTWELSTLYWKVEECFQLMWKRYILLSPLSSLCHFLLSQRHFFLVLIRFCMKFTCLQVLNYSVIAGLVVVGWSLNLKRESSLFPSALPPFVLVETHGGVKNDATLQSQVA